MGCQVHILHIFCYPDQWRIRDCPWEGDILPNSPLPQKPFEIEKISLLDIRMLTDILFNKMYFYQFIKIYVIQLRLVYYQMTCNVVVLVNRYWTICPNDWSDELVTVSLYLRVTIIEYSLSLYLSIVYNVCLLMLAKSTIAQSSSIIQTWSEMEYIKKSQESR